MCVVVLNSGTYERTFNIKFKFFSHPVGKHHKFFKSGDVALVVTGWRPGSGYTNTMRVVLVP